MTKITSSCSLVLFINASSNIFARSLNEWFWNVNVSTWSWNTHRYYAQIYGRYVNSQLPTSAQCMVLGTLWEVEGHLTLTIIIRTDYNLYANIIICYNHKNLSTYPHLITDGIYASSCNIPTAIPSAIITNYRTVRSRTMWQPCCLKGYPLPKQQQQKSEKKTHFHSCFLCIGFLKFLIARLLFIMVNLEGY